MWMRGLQYEYSNDVRLNLLKSLHNTRNRMHRIRLDQVDENPHDSVTSDLACGQWRLAARVAVLISDARLAAVPLLCASGPSGCGH